MSSVDLDVGVSVGLAANLVTMLSLVSSQTWRIRTGKFFTPPGVSS